VIINSVVNSAVRSAVLHVFGVVAHVLHEGEQQLESVAPVPAGPVPRDGGDGVVDLVRSTHRLYTHHYKPLL